MPASLQLATPTTVLPWSTCSAFTETRIWTTVQSDPYPDGRVQMQVQVAQPKRTWTLGKMLTHTEWIALQAFYTARKGALEPFYFYPDKSQYDASGVSTTGRYTVRFSGALSHQYNISRCLVQLGLVEIV